MTNKKRVLFVCIGNICRSPMAMAMARKYGEDCLIAESAGISPGLQSHATVRAVLLEKNVDLGNHLPQNYYQLPLSGYDVIINLSGSRLTAPPGILVEDWNVADPFGRSEEHFRRCRDEIEMLVMRLVLRIRTGKIAAQSVDGKAASSRE